MPYCPVCKHKFDDDVTKCPNDETALVEELPFLTVEGDGTAWVEIASVVTQNEARLIHGFLEAEGIPVQIESLKFTMEPVNLGALAEIRVFVDASREADAIRLIEERNEEFEALKSEESVVTEDGPAEIADDSDTSDENPDAT